MGKYRNAVGYALELRDEVNAGWFNLLADIAIAANGVAAVRDIEQIYQLLVSGAPYSFTVSKSSVAATHAATTTAAATGALVRSHMEEITGFNNFKLLAPHLSLKMNRRVTVVFGPNGTGKSSLCSAIKIITNPQKPDTPIANARQKISSTPQFKYKFRGDTGYSVWKEGDSFGQYEDKVKYFDSTVAIKLLNSTVDPGKVVAVAPFRLEIFEFMGNLLDQVKSHAESQLQSEKRAIESNLNLLKARYEAENGSSKNIITGIKCEEKATFERLKTLLDELKGLSLPDIKQAIDETETTLRIKQQAISEEGLKLLQSEVTGLSNYRERLLAFQAALQKLNAHEIPELIQRLCDARLTRKAHAACVPSGMNTEDFKKFIIAAQRVFAHDNKGDEKCPLCGQQLSAAAHELINEYYKFVDAECEKTIDGLEKLIEGFERNKQNVTDFDLSVINTTPDFVQCMYGDHLPNKDIASIISIIQKKPAEITEFDAAVLKAYSVTKVKDEIGLRITELDTTIATALTSKADIEKDILKLQAEIDELKTKRKIHPMLAELYTIIDNFNDYYKKKETVADTGFPAISRKITNQMKSAYSDLVIHDFQDSLNYEYLALAEKDMTKFGIKLQTKGADASVQLEPHVGSHTVRKVLSEGEQKIHALALFFCEAQYEDKDIIIFDDPVTSMDYNYIGSFCERLRNFIRDNADRQIIVFTHDWYFLKDLQKTLNDSGLDSQFTLLVMDSCSTISVNEEKADKLKAAISGELSSPEPFTAETKDVIFKNMRRLIEVLINELVFNNQRVQFKRDNIKATGFAECRKLISLTDAEAQEFKDLYRKLSPYEHDDVRVEFLSIDKPRMQTRYNRILALEDGIRLRRPT